MYSAGGLADYYAGTQHCKCYINSATGTSTTARIAPQLLCPVYGPVSAVKDISMKCTNDAAHADYLMLFRNYGMPSSGDAAAKLGDTTNGPRYYVRGQVVRPSRSFVMTEGGYQIGNGLTSGALKPGGSGLVHNGRANMLFFDGHVSTAGPAILCGHTTPQSSCDICNIWFPYYK